MQHLAPKHYAAFPHDKTPTGAVFYRCYLRCYKQSAGAGWFPEDAEAGVRVHSTWPKPHTARQDCRSECAGAEQSPGSLVHS